MANATLLRRDSYLSYLKAGVKADTLNALRTAPLHQDTLFPDSIVKRAEEDIASFDKGRSSSVYKGRRYHPYERQGQASDKKQDRPAWKNLSRSQRQRSKGKQQYSRPRVSSSTNDNQCVTQLKPLLLTGSPTGKTMNTFTNVKLDVVHSVHTAPEHSQKNEISPGAAGCYYKKSILKSVKSVSCVIPLSCVNPVMNAPNVVTNLPVGARLQNFWKTWLDLGAGPRVVQILKEGYTLPFRIRPNLSRTPTVISCYGNPHRNLNLLEALHQLMDKNAIELVHKKGLTRVLQPTLFTPQTQQQVETHPRPEQSESFPQDRKIQDGDTGNYQDLSPKGRMGNLHRLQGRLFPLSHTGTVQEVP